MTLAAWDYAGFGVRLLTYLGTAGAIGGTFSLCLLCRHAGAQARLRRYLRVACLAGAAGSVLGFAVPVGALADRGLAGLGDREIAGILWQTSVAVAALFRLTGFALLAIVGFSRLPPGRGRLSTWAAVAGGLLVAGSYACTGHLHGHGPPARLLVAVHVGAMSLWIGTLLPLWWICRGEPADVQRDMRDFGRLAGGIVAALVLSGASMLVLLVEHPMQLTMTDYGRGLLLKGLLVGALLFLASGNKWKRVPRLFEPGVQTRLAWAIGLEWGLAVAVLLLTAAVTSLFGP